MPKKRHSTLYSKPPSTVHHAPASVAAQPRTEHVTQPTVNELLMSSRRNNSHRIDPSDLPPIAPTLPGQIRQILAIRETPAPRPRGVRRLLGPDGRRLPPGPPPPQSWSQHSLTTSLYSELKVKGKVDARPDLQHLPGVREWPRPGSLKDLTLRQIAQNWQDHVESDQHYLATMPTTLRVLLMSYVARYGPDSGISLDGLSRLLIPTSDSIGFQGNDDFMRLDLSRSVGNSLHLKVLVEILRDPGRDVVVDEEVEDLWDEVPSPNVLELSTKISTLRYLSLACPSNDSNPWPTFLKVAPHLSSVTHLSLREWPIPQLSSNSQTAIMASAHGRPVNYGATGYYAHTLDNDWSEAAGILRRLSISLYALEWLDLDGCNDWIRALVYSDQCEPGIDWSTKWNEIRTLQLRSLKDHARYPGSSPHDSLLIADVVLDPLASPHVHDQAIIAHKTRVMLAEKVERHILKQRRDREVDRVFIETLKDDSKKYDHLLENPVAVKIIDMNVRVAEIRLDEMTGARPRTGMLHISEAWDT